MNHARRLLLSMLLAYSAGSSAQALPIIKNGPCPSRYYSSGQYCVPRDDAGYAIEKSGPCPSGYYSSGKYCVGRANAGPAIRKHKSCPSGYYSSGDYCVKR